MSSGEGHQRAHIPSPPPVVQRRPSSTVVVTDLRQDAIRTSQRDSGFKGGGQNRIQINIHVQRVPLCQDSGVQIVLQSVSVILQVTLAVDTLTGELSPGAFAQRSHASFQPTAGGPLLPKSNA